MSRRFFGTDGVRGRVGQAPMTPEFALRLGWAAGRVLGGQSGARVVIGKDTRRSGYLFESALEAGFAAAGMDVELLGPLPTPAVAYLTRALGAQAGVVISASHNPHHDNGVKLFGADGDKLNDAAEMEIESYLDEPAGCVAPDKVGGAHRLDDALARYVAFCRSTYTGPPLEGLHVVVDCANGAAYRAAPEVLRQVGAQVTAIAVQPNGFNINDRCGSTHLEFVREAVLRTGAQLGVALDGDGDRCLLVDHRGEAVDGDQIIYLIARTRVVNGGLAGPVVGTLMSNLGLELAIRDLGLGFERAAVGDRYVLERLKVTGGRLGGETSGHVLCLDQACTGDGIITALQVLSAMAPGGQPLADLLQGMHKLPQTLINVRVSGAAKPMLGADGVQAAVRDAEAALGNRGRVLLRASGTEPLIRVMVEAEDQELSTTMAERIADSVRAAATAA